MVVSLHAIVHNTSCSNNFCFNSWFVYRRIAMQIIHLTINKQWFDMIKSGEKKEEYREIKPYYTSRFSKIDFNKSNVVIKFRNGYQKDSPTLLVECHRISEGYGYRVWGASPCRSYILHIGTIFIYYQND
jgi:hypothetical protein